MWGEGEGGRGGRLCGLFSLTREGPAPVDTMSPGSRQRKQVSTCEGGEGETLTCRRVSTCRGEGWRADRLGGYYVS